MKLTDTIINAVSKDIEAGLSNRDACRVNDISEDILYNWLRTAKTAISKKKKTKRDRMCIKFAEAMEASKVKRKRSLVKKLEAMDDKPAALIFLLRNYAPEEYNRQPYLIANFDKLESYMESEYTEAEIQAIRDAILRAEDRRQAEITYNEDTAFSSDDEGDNRDTETAALQP